MSFELCGPRKLVERYTRELMTQAVSGVVYFVLQNKDAHMQENGRPTGSSGDTDEGEIECASTR